MFNLQAVLLVTTEGTCATPCAKRMRLGSYEDHLNHNPPHPLSLPLIPTTIVCSQSQAQRGDFQMELLARSQLQEISKTHRPGSSLQLVKPLNSSLDAIREWLGAWSSHKGAGGGLLQQEAML